MASLHTLTPPSKVLVFAKLRFRKMSVSYVRNGARGEGPQEPEASMSGSLLFPGLHTGNWGQLEFPSPVESEQGALMATLTFPRDT